MSLLGDATLDTLLRLSREGRMDAMLGVVLDTLALDELAEGDLAVWVYNPAPPPSLDERGRAAFGDDWDGEYCAYAQSVLTRLGNTLRKSHELFLEQLREQFGAEGERPLLTGECWECGAVGSLRDRLQENELKWELACEACGKVLVWQRWEGEEAKTDAD